MLNQNSVDILKAVLLNNNSTFILFNTKSMSINIIIKCKALEWQKYYLSLIHNIKIKVAFFCINIKNIYK